MVYNIAILRNQLESFPSDLPSEPAPLSTGLARWLYLKDCRVLWKTAVMPNGCKVRVCTGRSGR